MKPVKVNRIKNFDKVENFKRARECILCDEDLDKS